MRNSSERDCPVRICRSILVARNTVPLTSCSVRLFGTQATPPPAVLKVLPKIFGHTDKTVRAEGTALTHIMYQYIGQAIDPFLSDLKPVQVKELKEAFEQMEKDGKGRGSLKPERLTRAAAREAEAAEAAGEGDEGEDPPAEGVFTTTLSSCYHC